MKWGKTVRMGPVILLFFTRAVVAQPIHEPATRWLTGGVILPANVVAFNADGSILYTHCAADVGLKQWDFASHQLLALTPVPGAKTATAGLSTDRQRVIFCPHSSTNLFLCRVADGAVLWSTPAAAGLSTGLWYFRFSPHDELVLGFFPQMNSLRVWRAANGADLGQVFTDSAGRTNAFAWAEFVTDNEFVALAYATGEAIRFQAETGAALWRKPYPELGFVAVAALSPDRTEFCAAATNGVARYSALTGDSFGVAFVPPTNVTALAYSPDGSALAIALFHGGVEVRRLTNGALLHATDLPAAESSLDKLVWAPDGQRLVLGGSDTIYVWNLQETNPPAGFFPLVAHLSPACFSADGQWILTGSSFNEVVVLDARTGAVSNRWSLESGLRTRYLLAAPTTNLVVIPTADGEGQIRSLPDGALLSTVPLLTSANAPEFLDFSADGARLLASDGQSELAVFETSHWQALQRIQLPALGYVSVARLTPAGDRIVTSSSEDSTRVWNVTDNGDPVVIPAGGRIEFGLTTNELWTLGRYGSLDRWRMSDAAHLGGITLPVTNYTALFSADQRLLLTSEPNQPLKIWQVDSGRLVAQLAGPLQPGLIAATRAPDSRRFVATRRDGSLLAVDFPFVITNRAAGGLLRMGVTGAPGPFQLETRAVEGAGWAPTGAPFDSEISVPFGDDSGRLYRVSRSAL